MTTVKQLGIIILLSFGAAFLIYKWNPKSPAIYLVAGQLRPDELTLNQVLKLEKEGGVVWIDARKGLDYQKGHVEGAFLLNEQEDFFALLEPIWAKLQNLSDLPFVVYCGSESCAASRKVADKLRDSVGIAEVYILSGGDEVLRKSGLIN